MNLANVREPERMVPRVIKRLGENDATRGTAGGDGHCDEEHEGVEERVYEREHKCSGRAQRLSDGRIGAIFGGNLPSACLSEGNGNE